MHYLGGLTVFNKATDHFMTKQYVKRNLKMRYLKLFLIQGFYGVYMYHSRGCKFRCEVSLEARCSIDMRWISYEKVIHLVSLHLNGNPLGNPSNPK